LSIEKKRRRGSIFYLFIYLFMRCFNIESYYSLLFISFYFLKKKLIFQIIYWLINNFGFCRNMTEEILCRGFTNFKHESLIAMWSKKWMILTPTSLSWYKSEVFILFYFTLFIDWFLRKFLLISSASLYHILNEKK